ncbi:MAG: hypothetical protein HYX56_02860 [Chloroflexi bacterium]|nr:hypothetical protein [Chloroflexota bacterium]
MSARTSNLWMNAFYLPPAGGLSGLSRASSVANTLRLIFGDTTHDADFITPSYVFPSDTVTWPDGAYSVVFEHVHGNDTCNTTFGAYGGIIPECLYTGCGLNNCSGAYAKKDKATWQLDLIYIRPEDLTHYADVPWDLALYFANQIRSLIDGVDHRGRAIQSLAVSGLQNYGGNIPSIQCDVYLAGEIVNNPWTACFGGAESAHTADLTLAAGSDLGIACNTWARITDNASGLTIVSRVTDVSPNGRVEGTSGGIGWALKLSTACTNRTVRVVTP